MKRVLLLVVLAALSVPAVVQAGGPVVRYVDADGRAGPGGCGGSAGAFRTIQDAIDASGAGDTVLVCPGVYREIVSSAGRDGLTIRALEAHRAVIQQPPGQMVRDRSALVTIANARLEGFRIRPAPGAGCAPVAAMVLVYGTATVRGNRIVGSPPFQKDCGLYEDAVIHNSRGPSGTFELRVAANVIRDFRSAGVAFETELIPVNATIRRNVFARAHGEPATLKQHGYAVWTGFNSATVHVMRNLIRTAPGVRRMKKGIYSMWSVDSSIRANIISGVNQGIAAYGSAVVVDNVLLGGTGTGMKTGSDLEIERNLVRGFERGIVLSSTGATVRGNDFRGNRRWDCVDRSTGDGTAGTSNTWNGNLGHTSQPDGICRPVL